MPVAIAPVRRPELPALTSLRFVAAFWVVLFHVHEIGLNRGGSAAYLDFAMLGYLGVSFFFVLSGFILVYVYAGRVVAPRRFWQARFARIYPAYLFSLLVSLGGLFYFWPVTRKQHLEVLTLTTYPLLLEAWFPKLLLLWNPVGWSLSVEAFFYLLFPFVLPRLERLPWPRLRLAIPAFWLASVALTGGYMLLRPDGAAWPTSADNGMFWLGVVKLNPLVRLPEFLLGMGVGLLFLRLPARARSWPVGLGAALLFAGIALQRWIPYPMLHSGLLGPAFALMIFGFATQPAWAGFLRWKPLLLLGEASYSLYLLHGSVIVMALVMFGRSPNRMAVTVGAVAVAIGVSVLVYLLLENPLRRRLHPRYATPMVPEPEAAVRESQMQ